jgi:hypothetical protein
MEIMNRRKFFAFLPIAPVALISDGAKADTAKEQPREGEFALSIIGSNQRKVESSSMSVNMPITDPNLQISMSVGRDGNLWLKSHGKKWTKVLTQ